MTSLFRRELLSRPLSFRPCSFRLSYKPKFSSGALRNNAPVQRSLRGGSRCAYRYSSTSPSTEPPNASTISRIDRIVSRVPKFLRPYTATVLSRPGSHLTSFLILHELTAVVPLFGLFYFFHAIEWTPADLLPQEWVEAGMQKFDRYVEKKGWKDWGGRRVVVELAASYAVVKALLPARILLSLWAAPWFARLFIVPITRLFGRSSAGPPGISKGK